MPLNKETKALFLFSLRQFFLHKHNFLYKKIWFNYFVGFHKQHRFWFENFLQIFFQWNAVSFFSSLLTKPLAVIKILNRRVFCLKKIFRYSRYLRTSLLKNRKNILLIFITFFNKQRLKLNEIKLQMFFF